ncbi:MAG TPA: PPC domain-containing DNA-binding protein [Candidatus Saccharimonadales bacterium]|nr:PPC domain-containing DNA-binding protein [Candidatus Saccharimonadales bacterium]HSW97564.1 PPC domain-containing DNA-binding protein [Candidatus Saccharimonadales bacterium]
MHKIVINPQEEIIEIVTKYLQENNIKQGSIVSVIGAVDECCISTMPKEDAKKDILTEYHEPLEMSGVGEIQNGKPHIHATFGREGNQAVFGHLHWAKVKNWFVNVYILPLD